MKLNRIEYILGTCGDGGPFSYIEHVGTEVLSFTIMVLVQCAMKYIIIRGESPLGKAEPTVTQIEFWTFEGNDKG